MLGIYFHLPSTWWTLNQWFVLLHISPVQSLVTRQWNSYPLSTAISIQIFVFSICTPQRGYEQNNFTGVANSLSRLCNFILIMCHCLMLALSSVSFRLSYILHMFGILRYYTTGPVVVNYCVGSWRSCICNIQFLCYLEVKWWFISFLWITQLLSFHLHFNYEFVRAVSPSNPCSRLVASSYMTVKLQIYNYVSNFVITRYIIYTFKQCQWPFFWKWHLNLCTLAIK